MLKKIFINLKTLVENNNFQLVVIPSMRTPKNIINYAKEFFGENHTVIDDVDKKSLFISISNF